MPAPNPRGEITTNLSAFLKAGSVTEAHIQVPVAFDAIENSDISALIEVGPGGRDISPLSLQLLVSAERTYPKDQVTFGERACATLTAIGNTKEIQ
ncbi:hypothetical protein [Palleronia sp.]|uniref:hypothetical protein n=1 Tax=Palleronia sp. TaxID=1940284 RepID=UPI0035C86E8C